MAVYAGLVERGYAVALLVVGTAVGLTSSALLLNALLCRYVVTAAAAPYARPHPGRACGFALLFVPLWAYFARRVWHLLTRDPRHAAAPPPLPR